MQSIIKYYLFCICTYNRIDQIENTIISISKLKKTKNCKVEILVIDNFGNIDVKKLKKKFLNLTVVKEHKIGISHARNKALEQAKKINCDYICFLDDDCVLDKSWLINNILFIKKFNAKIVTGPHISKNNFFLNITERKLKHGSPTSWASTNNVIFDKKILKLNIKFSLIIQKYGAEDQLFFKKLNKLGLKIFWNSDAKVFDISSKKRISIKWFLKRGLGHGASNILIYNELYGKFQSILISILKLNYDLFLSILFLVKSANLEKTNFFKFLYLLSKTIGNFLSIIGIRFERY
jgi:GT2 family glycosyltransferase